VIEAVVFDLDGTLMRLPIDYEALFREFKRIMGVASVRPLVETVLRVDEKTRETVFMAWDRAELAVVEEVAVNEEGMSIYRQFGDKRRALVTLQGKAVVEEIMKLYGLSFNIAVTREDSLFREEQLTKAISLLNVEPGNVLFVGNTDSDASAAEEIGCQFRRVK
jgi:phosphoglycolate phosphatase-like HAD superfamily hydrolase